MQTGQGHDTRLVRGIEAKMNKAMRDYALIDEGDHVLVGLSGGKDSLALVELLGRRMRVYAPRFRATAVHVSVEHIPYRADLDFLRQHAEEAGMPLEHRTVAYDPTSDRRKSPCFLCSWHRRKALFETARELGCTKIALGHHLDDVVETLLLNMFFQGTTGTMPPRLRMDKFDMTLIRPLCLVKEAELAAMAQALGYRKQLKNCPYESGSSRSEMKQLLSRLEAGAKALRREQVSLSALARERLEAVIPPDSRLHTSVIVDDADEAASLDTDYEEGCGCGCKNHDHKHEKN